MLQSSDKAALLKTLRREKAYWDALLAVVREEDMLLPGVTGEWTFKDIVAHLTGWRKRTVARCVGALHGAEPPAAEWPDELGEDAPAVNEWMYRTERDRPLAEVLAESDRVWNELAEVLEAVPEADLLETGRFAWLEGYSVGPDNLAWSFQHLHEHAAAIDDWLARRYWPSES